MASTSTADAYINDAQQRILKLVLVLAGREIDGAAPSQIAAELGVAPPMVTRDLANLRHAGWAEQVPETSRWRLSPTPVQLSVRHGVALERAAGRLDEIRNRYSRG